MHRYRHITLPAMTTPPDETTLVGAAQPMRRRSHVLGFTLIELMVTVAIGTVLMVVAAPNLIQFRKNAQLSDAVSNLILATGTAKSAALKTGRDAYVVRNDNAMGWSSGWFVFVDNNWNQQYDAGTD